MKHRFKTAFLFGILAIGRGIEHVNDQGELAKWDESIYANVATNMLDGHWLVPVYTGPPKGAVEVGIFFEKPPFMMWLQSFSMALFGETPFAARAPSVLAFAGTVIVVYLFILEYIGNVEAILSATFLLFSQPVLDTHAAVSGSTDMLLTMLGTLFIYSTWKAINDTPSRRWAIVSGTTMGLAVMTKGVAAGPFGFVVLPVLWWNRQHLSLNNIGYAIFAGLLITLPWHLAMFYLYPDLFVDQYLIEQVIQRATRERFVNNGGIFPFMRYPYFSNFPGYIGVAHFIGLLFSGILALLTWGQLDRSAIVFIWYWAILFPVLYAIIGGNHVWYVLPSIVPISVAAAWGIVQFTKEDFRFPIISN